jgi:KAP family P-loop domain
MPETSESYSRGSSSYAGFTVLLDDPAEEPALGFSAYADAFAEIACNSSPRFAIGIFGGWGSGKTSLMQAIHSRISCRDDVIPVWFNAWRYEREDTMIVPLLDVLREALLGWAKHGVRGLTTHRARSQIVRATLPPRWVRPRALSREP